MRRRTALSLGATAVGTALLSPVARASVPGATSDDASYTPLGTLPIEGTKEAVVDASVAYLAVTDGFATVDVRDPASPKLLAERRGLLADREAGPLQEIYDVAIDGDRLLVVGPAHGGPPLMAAVVFDVSDPAAPNRVDVHETDYPIHNADLLDGYAYLTGNDGESNPVVIVDVEGSEVVAEWSILDDDDAWRQVPPDLRVIHDVRVGGDVAVLAYWDAGTVLLDVSDPADPAPIARVGDYTPAELAGTEALNVEGRELPGNAHYAQLNPGGTLLAIGREAWSEDPSQAPGGIDLWDVSTLDSPAHLARIPPPPTPDPSFDGTWTTAHNFDLSNGRLYSSWYQGGVKIHDVSDPADPEEIAWWRDPDETRFWAARDAGDFVVASDMGIGDSPAGLYTFPDRAGEQPDPPSLTPTPPPTETVATPPTGTTRPGTDPSSPTSQTPTETPPSGSQDTPTPPGPTSTDAATATDPATTTDGQSGYGVLAAIAGLGIGAFVRRLRNR